MPCRDYQAEEIFSRENAKRQQERLDKLTALLCKACAMLNESAHKQGKTLEHVDKELAEWYIEHRKADLENMYDLLNFASDSADMLDKEDFDKLDKVLNIIRDKYS